MRASAIFSRACFAREPVSFNRKFAPATVTAAFPERCAAAHPGKLQNGYGVYRFPGQIYSFVRHISEAVRADGLTVDADGGECIVAEIGIVSVFNAVCKFVQCVAKVHAECIAQAGIHIAAEDRGLFFRVTSLGGNGSASNEFVTVVDDLGFHDVPLSGFRLVLSYGLIIHAMRVNVKRKMKIFLKISADFSALISVIQFAGCPLHLPHDLRQAALDRGAAQEHLCRNVDLRELVDKIELRDLLIFPAKIGLIDHGLHILAGQPAQLWRQLGPRLRRHRLCPLTFPCASIRRYCPCCSLRDPARRRYRGLLRSLCRSSECARR
nr:MAG TPA: hypothetical protein [Caudoviricetes sp.]